MLTLKNRLQSIQSHLCNTVKSGKSPDKPVTLLAVSKTWPAEKLRELAEAGQRCFGENYLQEALVKIEALNDLDLEWHFIGPIQSNKTRDIAEHFDWVQSVERIKIARRLSEQRPASLSTLNICIQVNIDKEASKSGVMPDELMALAEELIQFPNLVLRGLMVIPSKTDELEQQQASFSQAKALFEQLRKKVPSVDTLSMGMSNDMVAAIEQGSTMVRIGSALFGQRATPTP